MSSTKMQSKLEEIVRRFGAETGTIHLLEDGVLVLKAEFGLPLAVAKIVALVPIGKGRAGRAVERKQPVSSCNLQTDRTGDVQPGAKLTGMNGAVVVPIRDAEGRPIGSLGIGISRPYEYTEQETAQLLAEAERIGAADGASDDNSVR